MFPDVFHIILPPPTHTHTLLPPPHTLTTPPSSHMYSPFHHRVTEEEPSSSWADRMDDLDEYEINPGADSFMPVSTAVSPPPPPPLPDNLPKPKTTITGDTKTVVSYELVEDEEDEESTKKKIKKVKQWWYLPCSVDSIVLCVYVCVFSVSGDTSVPHRAQACPKAGG